MRRKRYGVEGLEEDPPLDRVLESTTNYAKPLRSLLGMRRAGMDPYSETEGTSGSGSGGSKNTRNSRGSGSRRRANRRPGAASSSDALDVVTVLNQINEQLGRAQDLESFLRITVGLVKDLCRFSRVVIYQFDEEYNGKVVTELVDWGTTTDLWKGLMFPAADIPPQARELYRINKVRFLYDRSQMTARLVLRDKTDLEHPLDMTHCFLRAMSPIHLKYLANMHVRSSMSISIMAFGQLWGLIACHSYGSHGMRVSFPVRQMLRILSDVVSRNVERLRYAQRLKSRQLINTTGFAGMAGLGGGKPSQRGGSTSDTASDSHSSQGYIVSNADELLNIFDADSGLLVINDGCKLLGQCEQAHAMLAIAEYLRIAKFTDIVASNHITRDYPDLILPRATDTIAGLLYVPLTNEAGQDFIVLLRKGQVDEVKWAGRPYINEDAENKAVLEPRSSFKLWVQKVTGRSRQWTDDQLDSARVLSLIYGKFIHVWRERQNAMMSNQLTAILLSNTSHAVRTPLSQIINTLELALAGNIDSDTRNMLENSHQASRALLFHVHDLLDLTRIETGNETAFNDPFDLKQTIVNTVRLYQTETHRRGIGFVVTMADDLPPMVIGDSRKVKTVVSNLVANAVKYTREGSIEVTCRLEPGAEHAQDSASIEFIVSDTGCGIAPEKLEAMFVTLEGAEDRAEGGGVGLGLAVVARIVEQLHGQLRAESEVGKGTKFYFTCSMGVNADFRPFGSGGLEQETVGTSNAGPGAYGLQPSAAMATASLDHTKLKSRDGAATPIERSPTPAPVVEAAPPVSPIRSKVGPKGGPQLRVLVVEDDVINSQILQKRLKMDKHAVRAVENGQEAVDLIASDWDFDAVIMDIQMPIMNGFEAAEGIRALEAKTPAPAGIDPVRVDGRMPIFALSASLYEDDRVHLGTHFDGWLLKPLQFNRLRSLLAALLDGEKRAAELYQPGQWERGGYFRDGKKL
jgi:light-regulated signal transduction histidine kinase (bacteriophytochrome)/CheY-like chemotaxis protein